MRRSPCWAPRASRGKIFFDKFTITAPDREQERSTDDRQTRTAPVGTERPKARLHRRRGRRSSSRARPAEASTTSSRSGERRSTRTSRSMSSPIPTAISPRVGSTALPRDRAATRRSGRPPSPPTGTGSATRMRSGSRRSTGTTPTVRQVEQNITNASNEGGFERWSEAGHGRRAARRRVDAPRARSRDARLRSRPAGRADQHDQQRDFRQLDAQAAHRTGSRAVQPRASEARLDSMARRTWRPGTTIRSGSPCGRSSSA